MMLLDLPCAECIMEKVKKGIPHEEPGIPILTPFEAINNSGLYKKKLFKSSYFTDLYRQYKF
jgi:hypothetical protein